VGLGVIANDLLALARAGPWPWPPHPRLGRWASEGRWSRKHWNCAVWPEC